MLNWLISAFVVVVTVGILAWQQGQRVRPCDLNIRTIVPPKGNYRVNLRGKGRDR